MTWRDHCRPIIAKVLKDTAGKSEKEIKAALLAAYPYFERKYHPYKIWLDEIKFQRGKRKPRTPTEKKLKEQAVSEHTLPLFGE